MASSFFVEISKVIQLSHNQLSLSSVKHFLLGHSDIGIINQTYVVLMTKSELIYYSGAIVIPRQPRNLISGTVKIATEAVNY